MRRTNYQRCKCAYFLSSINHTRIRKLLTYAVLLQDKQTALNLLNTKQTIQSPPNPLVPQFHPAIQVMLSHTSKLQLPQFHPAIQMMLPSNVQVLPNLNVVNNLNTTKRKWVSAELDAGINYGLKILRNNCGGGEAK